MVQILVCIYLYTVLKVFSVHSLISILIVCGVYLLVCWTESLWCVFSCMLNWEFVVPFYLYAILMYSLWEFTCMRYWWVRLCDFTCLLYWCIRLCEFSCMWYWCSFVRIYLYAVLMCSFVMSDGSVVSAHCQAALSSCCFVGMSIKTRWTLK